MSHYLMRGEEAEMLTSALCLRFNISIHSQAPLDNASSVFNLQETSFLPEALLDCLDSNPSYGYHLPSSVTVLFRPSLTASLAYSTVSYERRGEDNILSTTALTVSDIVSVCVDRN